MLIHHKEEVLKALGYYLDRKNKRFILAWKIYAEGIYHFAKL